MSNVGLLFLHKVAPSVLSDEEVLLKWSGTSRAVGDDKAFIQPVNKLQTLAV